jgi:DNA-binding NtrC family response regulator
MSEPIDSPTRVAVIGDESARAALERAGLDAFTLGSPQERTRPDARGNARVVVVQAADGGGARAAELVKGVRAEAPLTDVVVWAPGCSAAMVREVLRCGASDVVLDRDPDSLARCVEETVERQRLLPAVERLAAGPTGDTRFEGMLSRSPQMWDIFDVVDRVATSDATVLIMGETGVGKDLLARALHRRSARTGRFVAVNCSSIPSELVESELFGHVKGAFTGATSRKHGLFEHADAGTLFLDEIGDMPPGAQQSLLRVLQERRVRPVGGREETPIDVRVIAATNAPLAHAIRHGDFREDLFYRLDVIRLEVPPLRERPEDIVYLFGHFQRVLSSQYGARPARLSDDFIAALAAHDWPGNVRQLENFAERAVLANPEDDRPLDARDFDELLRSSGVATRSTKSRRRDADAADIAPARARSHLEAGAREAERDRDDAGADVAGIVIDLDRPLEDHLAEASDRIERAYIEAALERAGGSVTKAAGIAGVSRRTLTRKLNALGIDRRRFVRR